MKFLKYFAALLSIVCMIFCFAGCGERMHVHEFGAAETVAESNCISEGVLSYSCIDCGFIKLEKTEKLRHDYVFKKSEAPTCVSAGIILEECSVCGNVKVEEIPVKPHEFEVRTVEADCVNRGFIVKTCSVCDFYLTEYTEAAKGHEFSLVGEIRGECLNPFIEIYKCSECGASENKNSENIAEHVFETHVTEPTCVSVGTILKKCVYCDKTSVTEIPAGGHRLSVEKTNATCCSNGKIISYCQNEGCGYIEQTLILDYSAHIMSIIVNDEECFIYSRDGLNLYSDPDCINLISSAACSDMGAGDIHFMCDRFEECGMKITAQPHDFVYTNTATCESNGIYSEICGKCGKVKTRYEVAAKGHNDNSVSHLCTVNVLLTEKYHEQGGDGDVGICYQCPDCGKFIPSIAHIPDLPAEDVNCFRSQKCIECGKILAVKEHTAPDLTCVSSKHDENYYCVVCKDYPMGKLTEHNFVLTGEIPAGCFSDKICKYSCGCGAVKENSVPGTATGHRLPSGVFICNVNYEASSEYEALYGIEKDIACKCTECGFFIETVPHELNCMPDEVTCLQNQHCLICGEIFAERQHEMPDFTCVSSKNDGFYYCKSCNTIQLGAVTEHEFDIEKERFAATCGENARVMYSCICGTDNPDGYVEAFGTKTGHRLPEYKITADLNCQFGHLLHFNGDYICSNNNCKMDFSGLVNKNGDIYCLDIYNYLLRNGYSGDFVLNEQTGLASGNSVLSMLNCCEKSGYCYLSEQHKYGIDPFIREDAEVEGVWYDYMVSTCSVKGSALFCCEKCFDYEYRNNVLPLDPGNHENELLPCGEHCESCAPPDSTCGFAFEITVLRSDGKPAVINGLPVYAFYNISFMLNGNRMVETVDPVTNEKYYVLTDKFIADTELTIGPAFASAEDAAVGDLSKTFDWTEIRLYKNKVNSVIVYIGGVNEE